MTGVEPEGRTYSVHPTGVVTVIRGARSVRVGRVWFSLAMNRWVAFTTDQGMHEGFTRTFHSKGDAVEYLLARQGVAA